MKIDISKLSKEETRRILEEYAERALLGERCELVNCPECQSLLVVYVQSAVVTVDPPVPTVVEAVLPSRL